MNNSKAVRLVIVAVVVSWASCEALGQTRWSPPASLFDLPALQRLPDLFTFANGQSVKSREDWRARREELKRMLLYYQYGDMPSRPDLVSVVDSRSQAHERGLGTMEFLTLEIDSQKKLRFRAVFYLPRHKGPRPVILREEGRIGHRKDVGMFLEKGYIFVEYARHDLDPDRDRVVGPAQAAYPSHDWATLSVWAWCGMRLVDYLETRDDVDMNRIGITGHSRGGKMALLTAALDERIGLVVPHQSGSGGAGSYRVLGPGAETLAHNDKPHWYHERLRWFGEQEHLLPFDQHFLKALVAPRALLCTESIDDEFANPLGTYATTIAVQKVYEFLDAAEKNAIHFRKGRHSTETQDWARILEFAEWQFFDRPPKRKADYWLEAFKLPKGFDASGNARKLTETPRVSDGNSVWLKPNANQKTEFVRVDAPGNLPDRNHHGQGEFGAVIDTFRIAETQVTNDQFAEFLNAVAQGDASAYDPAPAFSHAAIRKTTLGNGRYGYEVLASERLKPVTNVSWFDAARYCNWLHNGKPNGDRGKETTEDGAYALSAGESPVRNKKARFFLPTEDEWYKAAYFNADGGTYRHFARGVTAQPMIDAPSDQLSPFGMREFANGLWEWTESPIGELHRAVRSGAWFLGNNKQSAGHFYVNPRVRHYRTGFRIAAPASL